jgi:hypothetical protein
MKEIVPGEAVFCADDAVVGRVEVEFDGLVRMLVCVSRYTASTGEFAGCYLHRQLRLL